MTRETLIEAWQNYRRWDNEVGKSDAGEQAAAWLIAMCEDYAQENDLHKSDVVHNLISGRL